jgi:hypothetical protein
MTIAVPIHRHGAVEIGSLDYSVRDDDSCEVVVMDRGVRFAAVEDNLFDALLAVRAQLEPLGSLIAVRGASIDVWPSGMAFDMGPAQSAYRMTMGKQAVLKDLVDIFEVADDVVPATIAEQTEYREKWFGSLGSSRGPRSDAAV